LGAEPTGPSPADFKWLGMHRPSAPSDVRGTSPFQAVTGVCPDATRTAVRRRVRSSWGWVCGKARRVRKETPRVTQAV
jgi:hypothetical protein